MKKFVWIVLAIIVFISLNFIMLNQFNIDGQPVNEWEMSDGSVNKIVEFPFSEYVDTPGVFTFDATVDMYGANAITISQMYGYAIRVYFEDQLVYQVGSFDEPTANQWAYSHLFVFDEVRDHEMRNIRIESYALHDVGINGTVVLCDYNSVYKHIDQVNFINVDLLFMLLGSYGAVGLMLLIIAYKSRHQTKKDDLHVFTYFALASFGMFIFTIDGIFRLSTGSLDSLLMIRKISLMSLYLSVYCIALGLRIQLLNKKTSKAFLGILLVVVLMIITATDFASLNARSRIGSLMVIFSVFYLLYLTIVGKKYVMYFSQTFLAITTVHAVLLNLNIIKGVYLFQFGLFVFIMAIDFVVAYRYEFWENMSVKLSEEIMIDPLTGAFNRAFLSQYQLHKKDIAVFIDMDKFKQFNDQHGHDIGDRLLILLVNLFKGYFNEGDVIIRYGGDEFVVLLKHYTLSEIPKLMEGIHEQLHEYYPDADFSYGVIECTDSLTEAIIHADRKMYDMKDKRKS